MSGFLINISVLVYNRFDPATYPAQLEEFLTREIRGHVFLDVSAMSKLAILLTLDVCRCLDQSVTILYAEAREYGPTQEEYEAAKTEGNIRRPSIQVYTGIHKVVRIRQLSSVAMQGQPTAAIAFMSFNELLTQSLLDAASPSRLFLINSRPPIHRWREEATAWIHEKLRQEWPDEDNPVASSEKGNPRLPIRSVSTLKYSDTFQVLLSLYWKLSLDHRILLAPTGSKMQTVGCFLLKSLHPDVHIEYPTPKGFLNLYSTGIGSMWKVRFGRLHASIGNLARADQESHLSLERDLDLLGQA